MATGQNLGDITQSQLRNIKTGGGGGAVPSGGSTGQVLTKNSAINFDTGWATPEYVLTGGTTGQVLTKNSNSNFDLVWTTPSAGVNVLQVQVFS